DRVREALIKALTPERTREIHSAVAEAMDRAGGAGDEYVFALARHYANAGTAKHAAKIYETSVNAGRAALNSSALEDAYSAFLAAQDGARAAGIQPGRDFQEGMAFACLRSGRAIQARGYFDGMIGDEKDPLKRMYFRSQISD